MKPSSATVYARGRCGTASRKKRTEINNDPLILYSIMKKTFVAALAALALVSCSKEETVTYGTNGEPLDGAAVCLTFTDAPASRASLNSTAAAEEPHVAAGLRFQLPRQPRCAAFVHLRGTRRQVGDLRAAAFGGGYDVRLLRRCEPFAHGCYDQIGLALEGRSLRCGL